MRITVDNKKNNKIKLTIAYHKYIMYLWKFEVRDMLRTFQPNKSKEKKDHGFFARKEAGTGILNKRRKKGRKKLCK